MLLLERPEAAIERPDRDAIEVRWDGHEDGPLTFSVAEAYGWYQQNPRELVRAIERVGTFILISSVKPAPEALAVIVQGSRYNASANPAHPALIRPVVDELVAVVLVDNKYGYQFLTAPTLRDQLGLDDAALWDRAMRNTLARLEIDTVPLEANRPTELLRGDGLATSLLLVDEFWDPPRQNDVLVAAPVAPNKLGVAAERDTRSIKVMRRMMSRDPLDPHWRQFRGLLVRRQGRWEVLS